MARTTRDQVITLYREVLGREPYQAELAPGGFVDQYTRSGRSVDQLRTIFQSSDEARQRSQPASPTPETPQPATPAARTTDQLAADYAQPDIALAEATAAEERTIAEQGARRLREALSQAYRGERENDPYARIGIRSGAAQQNLADRQFEQTRAVEEDLTSKLSLIAQRLGASRLAATRAGRDAVSTQRNQEISRINTAGDLYLQFLNSASPIPPELYNALRNALGGA